MESKGSKDSSDLFKCGGHNTDKIGGCKQNGSLQMYT